MSKKETITIIARNIKEGGKPLFEFRPAKHDGVFTDLKGEQFFDIRAKSDRIRTLVMNKVKDTLRDRLNDKISVSIQSIELYTSVTSNSSPIPNVIFKGTPHGDKATLPFENGTVVHRHTNNVRKLFKANRPTEEFSRTGATLLVEDHKKLYGHNILNCPVHLLPVEWSFGTVSITTDNKVVVGCESQSFLIPSPGGAAAITSLRRGSYDSAFGEAVSSEAISSGEENNNTPPSGDGSSHTAGLAKEEAAPIGVRLHMPIALPVSENVETLLFSGVCERALHILHGSPKYGCVHGNYAGLYLQVVVNAAGLSSYVNEHKKNIMALNVALMDIGTHKDWFQYVRRDNWTDFVLEHQHVHGLSIPKLVLDLIKDGKLSVRTRTRCFLCRSFLNAKDASLCTPITISSPGMCSSYLTTHEIARKLNELHAMRTEAATFLQVGMKLEIEVVHRSK